MEVQSWVSTILILKKKDSLQTSIVSFIFFLLSLIAFICEFLIFSFASLLQSSLMGHQRDLHNTGKDITWQQSLFPRLSIVQFTYSAQPHMSNCKNHSKYIKCAKRFECVCVFFLKKNFTIVYDKLVFQTFSTVLIELLIKQN